MTTSAVSPTQPRLSVQAFWLTFSKFIAAVFNLATPIILVRILNQQEFGIYKGAFLFIATATSIAMFGVGVSAFYYMPRHPERGGQIALNILLYNLVAGCIPLLLVIVYPQVLNRMVRGSNMQSYSILMGLLVMLSLSSVLVEFIPTALQDVRNSTVMVVGTQLIKAIAVLAAALFFGTVRSLIWATIVSASLSIVVLLRYLYRRFGPFWTHFDPLFFREQLTYALPLGVYGMIYIVRRDMDKYFVGSLTDPAQFAIYSLGWVEAPFISLFLESVLAVMVVRVSALQHEDRVADIRSVMASAINRLAAVQFPLYAILLVAGRDLIVFFYTKAYEPAYQIFAITITLIVLNIFIYDPVVRAYKHLRNYILVVRVAVLAAEAAALYPIIREFGMVGAALAALTADLIERIIVGMKVCQTINATVHDLPLFKDLLRVMTVTLAAALATLAVRYVTSQQKLFLRLACMGVTFAAVYLTGFYGWKLPGWETISKEHLLQIYRSGMTKLKGANA